MKLGFIGTGNMGGAILKGYVKANPAAAGEVSGVNRSQEKIRTLVEELGIKNAGSIEQLVAGSDLIVVGVKPVMFEGVLAEMKPAMKPEKVVVSIAAGITMEYIEKALTGKVKVVRAMPNTPALVGEGMTGLCRNENVTDEEFDQVMEVFSAVGKAAEVSEGLMDAVGAVSGASPAYVYLFIEALADGGVAEGMYRPQAYEFAAQSVLGAAKMVLETGQHPGALKDAVCSPGGSTIEAVRSLEKNGMRHAVMEAVKAAADKTRAMRK